MKKGMIRVLLLLIACVPYAFLAVNGDAKNRTRVCEFFCVWLNLTKICHVSNS